MSAEDAPRSAKDVTMSAQDTTMSAHESDPHPCEKSNISGGLGRALYSLFPHQLTTAAAKAAIRDLR